MKVSLAPRPPALDHLLMRSPWPLVPDRLGQLGTHAPTASAKPEAMAENWSPEAPALSHTLQALRHRPCHGPAGGRVFRAHSQPCPPTPPEGTLVPSWNAGSPLWPEALLRGCPWEPPPSARQAPRLHSWTPASFIRYMQIPPFCKVFLLVEEENKAWEEGCAQKARSQRSPCAEVHGRALLKREVWGGRQASSNLRSRAASWGSGSQNSRFPDPLLGSFRLPAPSSGIQTVLGTAIVGPGAAPRPSIPTPLRPGGVPRQWARTALLAAAAAGGEAPLVSQADPRSLCQLHSHTQGSGPGWMSGLDEGPCVPPHLASVISRE